MLSPCTVATFPLSLCNPSRSPPGAIMNACCAFQASNTPPLAPLQHCKRMERTRLLQANIHIAHQATLAAALLITRLDPVKVELKRRICFRLSIKGSVVFALRPRCANPERWRALIMCSVCARAKAHVQFAARRPILLFALPDVYSEG